MLAQDTLHQPKPLDKEQKAIAEEVIGRIIKDIKVLKEKYPELEHFGEKPWFTREPGEFRYDYKIKKENANPKAEALRGGCGMYFSLKATYSPNSKWEDYYGIKSCGGDRAGIWHQFAITTDDPKKILDDAVLKAITGELDQSFERLAGEYVLRKHGIKQDTGSIIGAIGNVDREVRASANQVLLGRKLTPDELERLRWSYLQGKAPTAPGLPVALQLLKEQDGKHLPDFCLEMSKLLLQAEKVGRDTFMPTPFVSGPESELRMTRESIIDVFAQPDSKADTRFIPVALLLLNEDMALENRLWALDYFTKLPADQCTVGIVAGLKNTFRSVQAKAAELAGKQNVTDGVDALEALLASPSSKVRIAAREAIVKLGLKVMEVNPKRKLPESAAHIAETLWKSGLREEDVVRVCSYPDTHVFNPLPLIPDKSLLPDGVVIEEVKSSAQNGNPTANQQKDYYLKLTDPWRMTRMDSQSVRKRGAQFAVGIKKDWTYGSILDPTGPFLIAAAMKTHETATVQPVYERLCDEFETDDDMLYAGIEGLGWEFTLGALDLFQRGKDDEALKLFERVIALKEQSRPFTYLDGYVKLAREVSADIERRKKEGVMPGPLFLTNVESVRYWKEKIPEKGDRIRMLIAQLENSGEHEQGKQEGNYEYTSMAEQTLADEGGDAVEPLLESLLHDERLTRDVQSNMDHGELPVRWVSKTREMTLNALNKIFDRNFLEGVNYTDFTRGDTGTLEKIAAEVRKCRDTQK